MGFGIVGRTSAIDALCINPRARVCTMMESRYDIERKGGTYSRFSRFDKKEKRKYEIDAKWGWEWVLYLTSYMLLHISMILTFDSPFGIEE